MPPKHPFQDSLPPLDDDEVVDPHRIHHDLQVERRITILEGAAKVHADQVAEMVVLLRGLSQEIPKAISQGVSQGLLSITAPENIGKVVGAALDEVTKRAKDHASNTLWGWAGEGFKRVFQIGVVLLLAWMLGGKTLLLAIWGWLWNGGK